MNASQNTIADRAWAWYVSSIRDKVEAQHLGEYLVVNVDTGDYVLSADEIDAMERAASLYPPERSFGMRVGKKSMGRIGIRSKGNSN